MSQLDKIDARLERIERQLERLGESKLAPSSDLVLSRAEAARQLKVSVRQLHRLLAAGHMVALPSGISRAELERYVSEPRERLRYRSSGARADDARAMAERGRERLRKERRVRR